jgi:hypothetical protein
MKQPIERIHPTNYTPVPGQLREYRGDAYRETTNFRHPCFKRMAKFRLE